MKLIHTSDWHLGMSLGTGSYEDDQRHFFCQLYDLIRAEKVEAVLISGDIYDSGVANAEAIALYNEIMTTLCQDLGVTVIAIAGNHDSAPRLSACRELLKASGLYITGRLDDKLEPVLLDGGKVAVYALPFFGREEVTALFPERKGDIRSMETAMDVVCDRIRSCMDPQSCNIVLSHSLIVNAELSESDRSARVGFATAISKDVFRGFDYVALGHIHKPQVIDGSIRYCGSPLKYSFGKEEQQEKGVVLLDTETGSQRFISMAPLHDRVSARGTLEQLLNREELRDAYLRLTVTDRYAGLELIQQLREVFPNLLEVYGMGITEGEELSALTVEQLQTLDENDIMIKFMGENFSYDPTPAQQALFREVLAWSREEEQV